jgi:hypothetical protein
LQSVSPVAHIAPQLLCEHTCVVAQTVVQEPQCKGSVTGSTHTPLQSRSPAGQAQAPFRHSWPPLHTLPQLPQLLASLVKRTHVPPHWFWPVGQPVERQAPATQASPAAQRTPQPPQFWNEICVSTHWLLQSVFPTSHAHPPAEQI